MMQIASRSRACGDTWVWSAWLLRLALGSLLVAPGACRATPPAPRTPVRLAVGFPDVGVYNRDVGVAVLVALLEDERLLRLTPDGRFEPALAERVEPSPDGLVWTIVLRRGLTFQNNAPIDAQAVATRLRNAPGYSGRPGFRDIVSVEAKGPLEIAIHLRQPSHFLPDFLALLTIRSPGANSAGAGPFRVLNQENSKASLTAFPGYYRGTPSIGEVDIQTYKGGRNAWSALMRGEIDFLYEVTPDAVDFVQGSSATQVKSFLRTYVLTLGFNMRHPVLGQRAVRLALNQAVDRRQIVKEQFGDRAAVAEGMLWPKHWAYDPALSATRYAPAEAARLLDAAGLPVKRPSAGGMPSRFRFTCLLPAGDPRFERLGLMLQRQLIELGIDMQLEAVAPRTLVTRLGTGQYEAFLFEVGAHDLDWVYAFWHSPEEGAIGFIDSGYHAADAALNHLRGARTDDETRAAVADLERAMRDDPPAVPLCWPQIARAVSDRFRLPDVNDRDIWPTVWQWQSVPARSAAPTALIVPITH
jgi:peptide/nickel transport system substrate-binding protein